MTIRLLLDNYVDNANISATPSMETTLPVDNLKETSRSKVARSTSSASQVIQGYFDGTKDINAIVFARHNFVINLTYRIQLYSDINYTTQVYDSTTIIVDSDNVKSEIWGWGDFIWGGEPWGGDKLRSELDAAPVLAHYIATTQTSIRSFKITIAPGTSDAAYYEIGRLSIGEYIQPAIGISKNHGLTWEETTKQFRTGGGTLRSDQGIPYRKFEFDISVMSETDRVELQHQLRDVGKRKDFFISLFPDNSGTSLVDDKELDYSGMVKLVKVPKYLEITQGYFKSKYIMEEV